MFKLSQVCYMTATCWMKCSTVYEQCVAGECNCDSVPKMTAAHLHVRSSCRHVLATHHVTPRHVPENLVHVTARHAHVTSSKYHVT